MLDDETKMRSAFGNHKDLRRPYWTVRGQSREIDPEETVLGLLNHSFAAEFGAWLVSSTGRRCLSLSLLHLHVKR